MKQTIKLSQLRQIIREEVQKLIQPKIPIRLKELTNNGWILSEDEQMVINPLTGRKIKISSALTYPSSHPAHIAAYAAQKKGQEQGQGHAQPQGQEKDIYGNVLPPRPTKWQIQAPPQGQAQPKKQPPSYTVRTKPRFGFGR